MFSINVLYTWRCVHMILGCILLDRLPWLGWGWVFFLQFLALHCIFSSEMELWLLTQDPMPFSSGGHLELLGVIQKLWPRRVLILRSRANIHIIPKGSLKSKKRYSKSSVETIYLAFCLEVLLKSKVFYSTVLNLQHLSLSELHSLPISWLCSRKRIAEKAFRIQLR